MPISPNTSAHNPKAMKAGTRLGIRLISPNLKLRSATIRIPEISTRAQAVPLSMLSTFLSAILENMISGLAPWDCIPGKPFCFNQAWAFSSSARAVRVLISLNTTVNRTEDLLTLI